MDDVDIAQAREELERERAIEAARHVDDTAALIISGERCCIDCLEPIPVSRLEARPSAVRCIYCQTRNERNP